jgi:hypothetical protein
MKTLIGFLVALLAAIAFSAPAVAQHHGHGHSRVFFDFDIFPPYYPGYYPGYYPPPAYYYPPPPPVYYAPPVYAAPPPAPAQNCRRFNGDASLDASGAPFYGTACLQADGRWHIVN